MKAAASYALDNLYIASQIIKKYLWQLPIKIWIVMKMENYASAIQMGVSLQKNHIVQVIIIMETPNEMEAWGNVYSCPVPCLYSSSCLREIKVQHTKKFISQFYHHSFFILHTFPPNIFRYSVSFKAFCSSKGRNIFKSSMH